MDDQTNAAIDAEALTSESINGSVDENSISIPPDVQSITESVAQEITSHNVDNPAAVTEILDKDRIRKEKRRAYAREWARKNRQKQLQMKQELESLKNQEPPPRQTIRYGLPEPIQAEPQRGSIPIAAIEPQRGSIDAEALTSQAQTTDYPSPNYDLIQEIRDHPPLHSGCDELLKFLDVYVRTISNPKQCLDYFEKHVLEPFPDIVREPLVRKLKQDIDDKFLHTPVIDVPPESGTPYWSTPRIRKLDFPYQPTRLELDAKNAFMSEYPYLTRSIDYCKQRFDKLLFEFPSLNGDVDIMRVRKEIADAIDKRLLMENTVKGCVIKLYHNDGSVGVDRLHTEADYQKWIRNALDVMREYGIFNNFSVNGL